MNKFGIAGEGDGVVVGEGDGVVVCEGDGLSLGSLGSSLDGDVSVSISVMAVSADVGTDVCL